MKLYRNRNTKRLASSLLTTLIICSILSMFVMYYLSLIDQQSYLSARSQVWNMAIAVSEAGIEDGLEQLNSNQNYPNLSGDGWAYNGSCYWRSNSMPDGSGYFVTIYTTNLMNPTLFCRSFVPSLPRYACNTPTTMFATVNQTTPTVSSSVSRTVKVTCSKNSLFTAALAVKKTIDLNGNGVYTDSFNSQDPSKSTNGKYDASKYSGDKGDIGSNGGISDGSVSIQNANIYGTVHTGPGCPVSIGSQGGVGPHGGQSGNLTAAIAAGYVMPDANFTFPDTTFPSTSSYLTPTGGVLVVSSNYVTYATNSSNTFPTNSNIGPITTNTTTATVSTYPSSPVPPGITTNWTRSTTATLPLPLPPNITTNTASLTTAGYPALGTYIGTVTTNYNGGSGNIKNYTYNKVSDYTYDTVASYSYPGLTGFTYTLATTITTYKTNTYNNILWGSAGVTNQYVSSALSGSTYVTGPNVVLALPNGLSGGENITWNQGASLLVYSGGSSVSISGNQYINPNGAATSFVVFCAPTVTSIALNGNGQFTGVLVAPNANLRMNGGGNSNEDFCGSLMCNSVTMNGHFSFHYDEALQNYSLGGRFLVQSWNEVKQ
jgi:hypothetical protein